MIDLVYDPIIGLKFYYFGTPKIDKSPIYSKPQTESKSVVKRNIDLQRKILNPNKIEKV